MLHAPSTFCNCGSLNGKGHLQVAFGSQSRRRWQAVHVQVIFGPWYRTD